MTKEELLECVTEESIIEYYTGVKIEFNKPKYKNVLRPDNHGTCYFKKSKSGRVYLIDMADQDKSYDCFKLVMELYGLTFVEALNKIESDLNLIPKIDLDNCRYTSSRQSNVVNFKITSRQYTDFDYEYWNTYGISKTTLEKYKHSVIPALTVYKESGAGLFSLYYSYTEDNPCYIYLFKKRKLRVKLYQPLNKNTDYKWRSNTNNYQDVFGMAELPTNGDTLLITSSMKDLMALNTLGYTCIAPAAESILLGDAIMSDLLDRFTNIYSIFDFDNAGEKITIKYENQYGIKGIRMSGVYGKDPSDIIKNGKVDYLKYNIENFINKQNERSTRNEKSTECSSVNSYPAVGNYYG